MTPPGREKGPAGSRASPLFLSRVRKKTGSHTESAKRLGTQRKQRTAWEIHAFLCFLCVRTCRWGIMSVFADSVSHRATEQAEVFSVALLLCMPALLPDSVLQAIFVRSQCSGLTPRGAVRRDEIPGEVRLGWSRISCYGTLSDRGGRKCVFPLPPQPTAQASRYPARAARGALAVSPIGRQVRQAMQDAVLLVEPGKEGPQEPAITPLIIEYRAWATKSATCSGRVSRALAK
jgi:hypothetical protein